MVSGVILYAGRDHGLMQSRRVLLEQEGYVVNVCDNTEEFVARFLDGDYDLVLLCNSLRDAERERLTSLVHRFSRRTPVLLVSNLPGGGKGVDDVCSGEPQTVLDTISRLLPPAARRAPAKAGPPPASRARTGS